jgi:hypothetical protein
MTQANLIITRAQAKAQGLVKYHTGKPCKRSAHVADRYTVNGWCAECWKEYNRERYYRKAGGKPRQARNEPIIVCRDPVLTLWPATRRNERSA